MSVEVSYWWGPNPQATFVFEGSSTQVKNIEDLTSVFAADIERRALAARPPNPQVADRQS